MNDDLDAREIKRLQKRLGELSESLARMDSKLASSEAARAKAEGDTKKALELVAKRTVADHADCFKQIDDFAAATHKKIDVLAAERDSAVARAEAGEGHVRALVAWVDEDVARTGRPWTAARAFLASSPGAPQHNPLACPCCMAAAETTDPETHSHFERARDRRRALLDGGE